MTNGQLFDRLEDDARSYRADALMSIVRNGRRLYDLSRRDRKRLSRARLGKHYRRLVDALLADFINHVALGCGGDRGERAEHIRQPRRTTA